MTRLERTSRPVVGVFPEAAAHARPRLIAALTRACGVDLVPRHARDTSGLQAAVVFGADPPLVDELMARGIASFVAHSPCRASDGPLAVHFDGGQLDERLAGRTLLERDALPAVALAADPRDHVLAHSGRDAWWLRRSDARARLEEASVAPDELPEGRRLKDEVRAGRFLAMLPLVHFLRSLEHAVGWERPPLRASFLFDDPNLHRPSYGYIKYAELAEQAQEHRYHAGMAMIPLDAWYAASKAVDVFRSSRLSLVVHGNDHTHREFDRVDDPARRAAVARQAQDRVTTFERRYGMQVGRVVAPPHGSCSTDMMETLAAAGFDGISYEGPVGDRLHEALVAFEPADVHLGGGLPGLHRHPFPCPTDELVLRAVLDQPLILYGHHDALMHGMAPLAEAAEAVNQLGDVKWASLTEILQRNAFVLRRGPELVIRPFSRRVRLETSPDCTRVRVLPTIDGAYAGEDLTIRAGDDASGVVANGTVGESVEVHGGGPFEVAIVPGIRLGVEASPLPRRKVWPMLRRGLTEGRDRLQPLLRH